MGRLSSPCIDTSFDFTSDVPGYWDHFWDNNDVFGNPGKDPDSMSPTLREYHRILWSKTLPNGERMELNSGKSRYYLRWNDFYFGSDSMLVSFRYARYRSMLEKVAETVEDYHAFVENYFRKMYTIGGMIIFPQHRWSINQARGCNARISDRWDLTLECIRRHYLGADSPLKKALDKDKAFFDLFVDFKGYVDFFYLQDCVSEDYSSVVFWEGKGDFTEKVLPKTVEDYLSWIEKELIFAEKRNKRIAESLV